MEFTLAGKFAANTLPLFYNFWSLVFYDEISEFWSTFILLSFSLIFNDSFFGSVLLGPVYDWLNEFKLSLIIGWVNFFFSLAATKGMVLFKISSTASIKFSEFNSSEILE